MIYGINLTPFVPVCLHCGELNADGALFCTKCGFTLPQVENSPAVSRTPATPPSSAGTRSSGPPADAAVSPPGYPHPASILPPTYMAPVPPGAVGPMPPPLGGKYCIHCRTIISQVAVYCPVCQRPQA